MKVWVKSLIGSLLALLGFQSCEPSTIFEGPDMYGPGPVEYGCPTAVFKFKGEASDELGNPIPGIRIAVLPRGEQDEYAERDTLFTGTDGKVIPFSHTAGLIPKALWLSSKTSTETRTVPSKPRN